MATLLDSLPAKAKKEPSPHEVRLAPFDTSPVLECLREKCPLQIVLARFRWFQLVLDGFRLFQVLLGCFSSSLRWFQLVLDGFSFFQIILSCFRSFQVVLACSPLCQVPVNKKLFSQKLKRKYGAATVKTRPRIN